MSETYLCRWCAYETHDLDALYAHAQAEHYEQWKLAVLRRRNDDAAQ